MDSVDDKLRYKKLRKHATAPTRATAGSVGYDLYSAVGITLSAGCCVLVPTDIALQCPKASIPELYLAQAWLVDLPPWAPVWLTLIIPGM